MSSRICVKNLPKHVAEDRLREFFSRKGEITDTKLMRTKDGKSRQFAFVGYRTEKEAEEAIKFFDKSFMDTCRITCEIARKVGDPNIPRPWSRHSLKKQELLSKLSGMEEADPKASKVAASKRENKKSKKDGGENEDPQLEEFLEVMQARSKSKLWANDAPAAPSLNQFKEASAKKIQVKELEGQELNKLSPLLNKEDESDSESLESKGLDKDHGVVHDELVSDMDYFKSRVTKEWSDSESSRSEDSGIDDDDGDSGSDSPDRNNFDVESKLEPDVSDKGAEDGHSEESVHKITDVKDEKEEILETGRLFVRNLPYTATEEELQEHFSRFGNVSQVHIVVDKDTKRSKGIAYVLYALPEAALRALEELDNSIFQGRLLHVMPAKQQSSSDKQKTSSLEQQSSKTFKQQRNEEKKMSEAGGNTRAWNSLFMRPDTVVENIARKFGVSKSDLLDREADDLAVRIALGETQVIAETKKALTNAGINIASLEEFASGETDRVKRSNHVILVKNLPYSSSESELANMFGKFGSLDKVVLPPTKTLALVVFLEAAEARAAYRGLAYKRYKDGPLYLEWAPDNILYPNPTMVDESDNNGIVGEHEAKRVFLEQQMGDITDADIDPDRVESRSLYVKNLNFKTSDETLRSHFTECIKGGKVLSAKVKKHLKNGKNVSMGFGFIEFDSVDTAVNICRDLQGTVLDGHALILQLCHAKNDEHLLKRVEHDKSSTKLIVRNVAFEATEKDLRQLFSPFGQIRSLRLPMRFGNHRGFAFVEYVTKQEAQNALQALANTHLYGRHLVLERAKEGESLEELRARTGAQFTDGAKLSKKRKHMAILDEDSIKFQRIAD